MTAPRCATLLVALVALAASSGCRQILGADEFGLHPSKVADAGAHHSGSTFTGSCDGVGYSAQSCAECASAPGACCDAARACSAEPACNAMARCLARCDVADSTCRGACNLTIPQTRELLDLISCEAKNCAQCGAGRIVWGNAACDSCLQRDESCSKALSAVSENPSELHDDVASPCTQAICDSALPHCACDRYGNEAPNLTSLLACTQGRCQAYCNPPSDYSCLGAVKRQDPPPLLAELELHLTLENPGGTSSVGDFEVLPCKDLGAVDCHIEPGDGGDANGLGASARSDAKTATATLRIQRQSDLGLDKQFFGHLFVLPTDTPPDQTAPALMYFFPPLRTSPVWVTRRIVSKQLADTVASVVDGGAGLDWKYKGGIAFTSASCYGGAPGISVTLRSGSRVYYLDDAGLPDLSATKTSSQGIGFAWNLAPGTETITATVGAKLVGRFPVLVRAGAITHLVIRPIEPS